MRGARLLPPRRPFRGGNTIRLPTRLINRRARWEAPLRALDNGERQALGRVGSRLEVATPA